MPLFKVLVYLTKVQVTKMTMQVKIVTRTIIKIIRTTGITVAITLIIIIKILPETIETITGLGTTIPTTGKRTIARTNKIIQKIVTHRKTRT